MAMEYPRSVKARCLRKKVHGYAEPGVHGSNNDDAQITHCWDQIDNEEQPKEWGLQLRTVSDAFQNEFTQHCEILFLHAGIVQILSRVERIMKSKKLGTFSSSGHLLNKSLGNVIYLRFHIDHLKINIHLIHIQWIMNASEAVTGLYFSYKVFLN